MPDFFPVFLLTTGKLSGIIPPSNPMEGGMAHTITAEERGAQFLEELAEGARMSDDEARERLRELVARGGLGAEVAGIALAIDAQRSWGVGVASEGIH